MHFGGLARRKIQLIAPEQFRKRLRENSLQFFLDSGRDANALFIRFNNLVLNGHQCPKFEMQTVLSLAEAPNHVKAD